MVKITKTFVCVLGNTFACSRKYLPWMHSQKLALDARTVTHIHKHTNVHVNAEHILTHTHTRTDAKQMHTRNKRSRELAMIRF